MLQKRYSCNFDPMPKFLIIQTSFIGDVVLATALVEKLHQYYPQAKIDFLVRKGNESLLEKNPHINEVLVWNKKENKHINLLRMAFYVRKQRYTHVINIHRFATSGLITFLSGAKQKIGFDKNPFSFCYTKVVKHTISEPYAAITIHETERNQALIDDIASGQPALPRLYPTLSDYSEVKKLKTAPYICIAPFSVWFTKQFPVSRWIELINILPHGYNIYLLGGPSDKLPADEIIKGCPNQVVSNLSGTLSFLQSAALMEDASMNYVNDSAPLHFASAMNAPVTAVYCSTVPAFGFGPVRNNGKVVEIEDRLYCRPCGLHGHKTCPEGHFKCALEIKNDQLLWWISNTTKKTV